MLKRLSISNYAIIDELEIEFPGGLNIITGETGAGKSIIMGALGLILGERADMTALVKKEKKSVVEGVFAAGSKKNVIRFLKNYELDIEEELVVRREIGINGKSRAFINDTPVNLAQLQELSSLLVDLHRQFDTIELGETGFQREVLDALAGHQSLLDEYQEQYYQWQHARKEWEDLLRQQQQFEKEADYNRFQYTELEEAGFRENELEEAETELKMLEHAEGIREAVSKSCYTLNEAEQPVVQQLKAMLVQLQIFSAYHPDLPALLQRLQSAQIEIQDIAADLNRINDHIQADPARLEQLSERISLGYRLQKKHGLGSTRELLLLQEQLAVKLKAVQDIGEAIAEKEAAAENSRVRALQLATRISANRKKLAKPFAEKVNQLLARVGMPNARLQVSITDTNPGETGTDLVEFLFDANLATGNKAEGQYQPLRKVASGGERSRLMLCIKSLVARSLDLPTLIFDEIDTGISGEAARQVGIILKELASSRQIICITHQPQIAGRADAHYFVYKEIAGNQVKTGVRLLNTEERITSIARMLSGEKPTAAALENAREMLRN